ncbi:MAG: alkyl hydroperoxide reductase [Bacteroidetes bacterium CG_4_10_14_3_um_filter_31_20]|nr:MAG: alkyl hydroperoxide reductase [Bacteroidetes bacterium CG_4_8_14_3_um_filter_31_14]PIY03093.1 MAG: alkyl hydroperoxide reductase [Bacteroidetes bacterium CG_4_10_14_3_um_filter_31_20]
MKIINFIFFSLIFTNFIFSQTTNFKLPSIDVKTLDGKKINTSDIKNDGKPILIDFWATWCKPCIMELTAIAEKYQDWQTETGVKFYAVSVDDSKSMNRVAPFVNGKGWEYIVLLDPNSDFKRAMNVINIPHTFLVDGNGNVVYQHTTYSEGDEDLVYEKIKKLAKGEKINE